MQQAFFTRFPDYPRGITVPAIVDIPTGMVVTNDYPQITIDLETEWVEHHRAGAPDLYPDARRAEIDEVALVIFHDVNNGVYKCGFAGSQTAYERAYHAPPGLAGGTPGRPALPGRRHDHRARSCPVGPTPGVTVASPARPVGILGA